MYTQVTRRKYQKGSHISQDKPHKSCWCPVIVYLRCKNIILYTKCYDSICDSIVNVVAFVYIDNNIMLYLYYVVVSAVNILFLLMLLRLLLLFLITHVHLITVDEDFYGDDL